MQAENGHLLKVSASSQVQVKSALYGVTANKI
jgi:hypothetical protein